MFRVCLCILIIVSKCVCHLLNKELLYFNLLCSRGKRGKRSEREGKSNGGKGQKGLEKNTTPQNRFLVMALTVPSAGLSVVNCSVS